MFGMLVSNQNCESVITKRINISVSNAPKGDQIWLIHPAYFSADYFTYNFITSNMSWYKKEGKPLKKENKAHKMRNYMDFHILLETFYSWRIVNKEYQTFVIDQLVEA